MLNDLKSRGVQDVYVFCVDGPNGFRQAIGAVYPKAQMQALYHFHQIRSSTRYVSYKDIRALMADFKPIPLYSLGTTNETDTAGYRACTVITIVGDFYYARYVGLLA